MRWFKPRESGAVPDDKSPRSALQGWWGERKAKEWLIANAGLKFVAGRVRVGRNEIDLIMEDPRPEGRVIVFVEVKTRASHLFGGGFAAVDRRKRRSLCRAAIDWLRNCSPTRFRIDVVLVYGDFRTDRVDRIVHQKRAVSLDPRIDGRAIRRRIPARRLWS